MAESSGAYNNTDDVIYIFVGKKCCPVIPLKNSMFISLTGTLQIRVMNEITSIKRLVVGGKKTLRKEG